jgi:hypothetical protein
MELQLNNSAVLLRIFFWRFLVSYIHFSSLLRSSLLAHCVFPVIETQSGSLCRSLHDVESSSE